MGILNRDQQPVLEFISRIPGLINVFETQPKPANKYTPDWWRTAPYFLDEKSEKLRAESTMVRLCPAFPELFSSGYVLPMWADTTIYFNSETKEWQWRCGNTSSPFSIGCFPSSSFTDHASYKFFGEEVKAVFQFENPWVIRASEGYSVFQMPLFYNSNNDFGVLPGIYDPHTAETNKLEIGCFVDNKEIFIKRGTPLVQYIPFKNEDVTMVVRDQTEEDKHIDQIKFMERQTTFKTFYAHNRNRK